MNITCKECNKEFEPKQDMLRESPLGAMMTETYFKCPNCDKKYLVCINTPKARKLMRDIRNSTSIGDNIKVNELKKELKIEMNRSNGKSA